jgi:hypothetical protein
MGATMAILVTLQVFSGRPDPSWTLSDAEAAEFSRRVADAPPATATLPAQERLGYRGFRLEDMAHGGLSVRVYDGAIVASSQLRSDPGRALERWLLTTGTKHIDAGLRSYVAGEIR